MQTESIEATWPLWKCLKAESQAQFIEYVWENFGIDLLKEDKPVDSVTYSGELEEIEEIDKIIRKPPLSRRALRDGEK